MLGLGIGLTSQTSAKGIQTMQRVRVFVDFWNFHLSVQAMSRLPLKVNWQAFGLRAAQAVSSIPWVQLGGSISCEGTHIYGSYATSEKWQVSLATEMLTKHALLPGVFPVFEKREKKASNRACDHCGEAVMLSPEQGIDVRLAIDVVKFSNFDPEAVIVLATNDSDFIPLVEYLTGMGRKIVHLHPTKGNESLSQKCWANVALEKVEHGAFPFAEDKILLIKVPNDDGYNRLEGFLEAQGIAYRVLDFSSTKASTYELCRIFAENPHFHSNFEDGTLNMVEPHIHNKLSSIDDAIAVGMRRPDLLRGPFLLRQGQILNRSRIESLFDLRLD